MTKLHYIIFSFLFLSVSLNNFAMESEASIEIANKKLNENVQPDSGKKKSKARKRKERKLKQFASLPTLPTSSRTRQKNAKKKQTLNAQRSVSQPNSPEKSPQGSDSDSPQAKSLPGSPRFLNNPNDINLGEIQLDEEGDEIAADGEKREKKSVAKQLFLDDIVASVGQQLNLSEESFNEPTENEEHKNCDGIETDSITDDVEKDDETNSLSTSSLISPTGSVIVNDISNKGEKKQGAIDESTTTEGEQLEDSDNTENGVTPENFSPDISEEEPEDFDGKELEESGFVSGLNNEVAHDQEEETVDPLAEVDKNENANSQANEQSVTEEQPEAVEEGAFEAKDEANNGDNAGYQENLSEDDFEEAPAPLYNSAVNESDLSGKSEADVEQVKKFAEAVMEQITEVASVSSVVESERDESASEDEDLDRSEKEEKIDNKDELEEASENLSPEAIERRKLVARGLKKYLVFARQNNPDNLPIDIPSDEDLIVWAMEASINEDGEIEQNPANSTLVDTSTQGGSEIQQTQTNTGDPITSDITSEDRPTRNSRSKILPAIIAVTGIGVIGAMVYRWVKDLPLIRSKKVEDNNSEKTSDEKTK